MTGGDPMPARGCTRRARLRLRPRVAFAADQPSADREGRRSRDLAPPDAGAFTRNFDKDPTVTKDTGRAEAEGRGRGILAWCVRGAVEYQREGLNRRWRCARRVTSTRATWICWPSGWIDAAVGPAFVESSANLWASWEAFAKARGELRFIASSKALGRRLQSRV